MSRGAISILEPTQESDALEIALLEFEFDAPLFLLFCQAIEQKKITSWFLTRVFSKHCVQRDRPKDILLFNSFWYYSGFSTPKPAVDGEFDRSSRFEGVKFRHSLVLISKHQAHNPKKFRGTLDRLRWDA